MRIKQVSVMALAAVIMGCATPEADAPDEEAVAPRGGQETVQDDQSQPDVVKVAVRSPDHTTLVAALQAADLVTSLANAGPFTVFAPNNAAFEKLPAGVVDDLLKPANKSKLGDVLLHHVTTSALNVDQFSDGQVIAMAGGGSATVTKVGDEMFVDGAKVIGSVRASNGWVHVVDAVILQKP